MLYLSKMAQITVVAEEKGPLNDPSALPDKQTNYLYRYVDEVKIQLLISFLHDLNELIECYGHQSCRSEACDSEESAICYD